MGTPLQPVEVVLVLFAPLGLIALGLLELLLGPAPLGVGLRGWSLAGPRPAAGEYESHEKERDGDGDEDDDRQHALTLLPTARSGHAAPGRSPQLTLLPAGLPNNYDPTGLYHDRVLIPICSTSPLSAKTHICVTSFTENKYSGFVATGQAGQKGRIGIG